MSEANVLFTLDGINLAIKCTTEDKMDHICKCYSTKINKNMNSLIFLYEGNKVNFDLSFKEQASFIDKNNHQMKIIVFKCDEKKTLNSDKLHEILLSNNKIEDNINEMNSKIDEIIKKIPNYFFNKALKIISELLNMISGDIKKNNEKIKNLFNDCTNTKSKSDDVYRLKNVNLFIIY